jgi:hypothetical protein
METDDVAMLHFKASVLEEAAREMRARADWLWERIKEEKRYLMECKLESEDKNRVYSGDFR